MSLSEIKFIAADMDGTLLDPSGKLAPEFFHIYQTLEDKGIIFAAASGRQYYSLRETFAPINDRMMFIAENGTLVMHQGKELYSCGLASSDIKDIIQLARTIDGAHIVLCGKESAYVETKHPEAIEEISKYYHRCQYVPDLLDVDEAFIKVAICHFEGSQEKLHTSFSERFDATHQVVVSAKIWLDVMNAEASKGAAIRHLQQTLGFTRQQTMSFGDYFNDVEMLKQSYHSYAMANAHPEVKALARFIAPSNEESGVLQVIQQQVLSD
ncbi:TPA: Cof-type HAD-IIB family hydrolase [Vibrio vulnificus]|uniref:HAD family hydrolase n=2 Tax=Vibrio vulnificus TaxID=672 RepID=UPI0005F2458C|nr:HAD family hydrolase [Vibrio vulnificus]ELE1958391.1 HAD family hydrolase [Vibrio vulnificus]ELL0596323.1 HAD family hydrolase [Vibrio vulnificus]ELM6648997.1 HAD family hydrolase [Vibrio vulnificus]ELV8700008.1 HAD family hydrolase [Vibrio vulnificus]ELV8710269.1 HAD family hydrolase [Vibrio vulnificus]